MGLCAAVPVHLAIDSAAVVARLRQLLSGCQPVGCRVWGLTRDGDIWERVQQFLEARGVGT
eukprot:14689502-Alexandrium_andersonii.AAC.1